MQINDIISGVNAKLAGETLTFNELKLFLDEVVDDINTELNAKFPVFSAYNAGDEYTAIPDNYIRSVIFTGAAAKFYETDEEGIQTATQYMYDYKDRLFFMKRDYSYSIPDEYQADNKAYLPGVPDQEPTLEACFQGWW